MKPRNVAVSFVIPDCMLPKRVLESKRWGVLDARMSSYIHYHEVILDERPKVNPIQKRTSRRRKP